MRRISRCPLLSSAALLSLLAACAIAASLFVFPNAAQSDHHEKPAMQYPVGEWVSIFNGKNLEGWTPKFAGHELGENYKETFRVEDGNLCVNYDNYEKFGNKFGHIFYKDKFSHYKIRLEYRFVGKQVEGGPGWAFRNSGIMIHCQDPKTMGKGQSFPVSIEVQTLGGDGQKN
ncbi:MAG: DUF1080 domain-containing protein, partial [Rhodospirillales bacterium]|nr:DUF1080 domain-containing protein [Rhodospirillales bacterium]